MNLGMAGDTSRALNPEAYDTEPAKNFAAAVSDEIENFREKQGGFRGGQSQTGLLADLLLQRIPGPEVWINQRAWHTFLTDLEVMKACCGRLGISRREYINSCLDLLHPPNWEALFWMGAWLDQLVETLMTADSTTAERLREAQEQAISEHRKKAASTAAHAKFEKRYAGPKQWVQEHWLNKGGPEYDGNKSKFARDYVLLIKDRYAVDITHATITNTWLKDI